jgi:hypothetical protein
VEAIVNVKTNVKTFDFPIAVPDQSDNPAVVSPVVAVPHTDAEESVSVPLEAANPSPPSVDSSTPDPQTWLGKWVLVRYDKKLYPGVVQEVEEEDVLVKCMARVGENRFFWPMLDDTCWFFLEDILSAIEEPKAVGSRHVQVDPDIWEKFN